MKNNSIQTKRDAGKKGGLKILHATTRGRKKQRAVAATPEDLGADVPNVGIGRALIVILVLHVVAIGAVIMHTSWTDQQGSNFSSETPKAALLGGDEEVSENQKNKAVVKTQAKAESLPNNRVVTRPQAEPATQGVTQNAQPRLVDVEFQAESAHSVVPRIAATQPQPEVIPVARVEQPVVVRPNGAILIYEVQSGDTMWGISRRFKMSVDEIKKLNALPSNSIKIGQKIKVRK